jgi:hypothetical protein
LIEAADIYRVYFHGPAYRVLERAWRDGNRIVGQMPENLPSHHHPSDQPLLAVPRLIELCFQTAGLWQMGAQGQMGLPHHVDQVRFLRAPELAGGPFYAVVTPDPDQARVDAEVVDAKGHRYVHMRGYRTVALPNSLDARLLKPLRVVMSLEAVAA